MKPFTELVVVERGGSIAGAYCGKLFADNGAAVTVVGDDQLGPYQRAYLQAAKCQSGQFDPAAVDVIIESSACEPLAPVSIDAPAAVRVQVSPFGSSGPYAGWRGTDLTDYALGGHLYLYGDPAREPLRGPAGQPAYAAGLFGFVGAMAALLERERSGDGRGQLVEVSHVESMVALHQFTLLCYAMTGRRLCRMGNRFTGLGQPNGLYRCADGWLSISTPVEAQVDMLLAITELDDLLGDPRITSSLDFQSHPELLDAALVPWLAERPVGEVTELFQAVRIPAAPATTMSELLADDHLATRQYWRQLADGRVPGPPFRFSHRQRSGTGAPPAAPAGAPSRVDEAGDDGDGDGATRHRSGPLGGLRVLDLTRVWAGPLATRILADLGADVVCVEAPWARGPRRVPDSAVTAAGYYPGGDQGECQWNRNTHFAKYALGKRSVVLDLTHDAGRSTLEAMVGRFDVLIENYSPRVMPQLGLDETRLHELNPDLLYVTMPGYGRSGPAKNWVAYGTSIDAHAGLSTLIGYHDQSPWKAGVAWPDPLAGLHAAAGILIGLWQREAGDPGGGVTIETPQFEATIATIGDRLLEAQAEGDPGPRQNREPGYLAQGVYPCAGDDRWIAISVPEAATWAILQQQAGLDHRLLEDHDALDTALAGWTKGFEHRELMTQLQRAGVPAGAVLDAGEVLDDPHLLARQAFVTIDQPEIGPMVTPMTPIRLSASPVAVRRPAPKLGQHNAEVLATEAGLDPAAIAELEAMGVVADEPPY